MVVSVVHGKKYLLLVLYTAWTVIISGLDTLLWFLLRVEHSKIPRGCKNGSVPLHSRGYANSDYVHILHAIDAATTRNQTGPPPQSAQRNRVSRRNSQCTRRYTRITVLVAWEAFAFFLLLCVNWGANTF